MCGSHVSEPSHPLNGNASSVLHVLHQATCGVVFFSMYIRQASNGSLCDMYYDAALAVAALQSPFSSFVACVDCCFLWQTPDEQDFMHHGVVSKHVSTMHSYNCRVYVSVAAPGSTYPETSYNTVFWECECLSKSTMLAQTEVSKTAACLMASSIKT